MSTGRIPLIPRQSDISAAKKQAKFRPNAQIRKAAHQQKYQKFFGSFFQERTA
jgi:hypothetical protein